MVLVAPWICRSDPRSYSSTLSCHPPRIIWLVKDPTVRRLNTGFRTGSGKPPRRRHGADQYLEDLFRSSAKHVDGPSSQRQQASTSKDVPARPETSGNKLPEPDNRAKEVEIIKRLSHSVQDRHLKQAEKLWDEVESWLIAFSKDKANAGVKVEPTTTGTGASIESDTGTEQEEKGFDEPKRPNLFDRFLSAFMSLRGPDRALKVWNSMISAGLQPTGFTWNAMLDGFRKVWDLKSLEAAWQKMRQSGFQPDVVCWTTRIHALTRRGHWQQGVRALNEMGQEWQEATKRHLAAIGVDPNKVDLTEIGDIGEVVKPTAVTINAVVNGLLHKGLAKEAHSVLRWSAALGIRPDAATYNTLLGYSIQKGNAAGALKVFKKMEEAGFKSDLFTFTIVLDGFFRSYTAQHAPASEQTQVVSDILGKMEAAGIEANIYSYGILIDNLLKGSNNLVAAQAVLTHMMSRRIRPTAHINTMFLTHHLAQSPPDLAAVDALWHRLLREGHHGGIDVVLYDRFLHGWAATRQIAPMMRLVQRMSDEGHAPSWDTLFAVVRALALTAHGGDAAARIIGYVLRHDGLCRDGIRGSKSTQAEPRFWALVAQLKARGLQIEPGLHAARRGHTGGSSSSSSSSNSGGSSGGSGSVKDGQGTLTARQP